MAGAASDRSVNKIALCGAIFAGVAYVGYSVVKQALGKTFTKSRKRKDDEGALLDFESHRRKIYLRRLSGSGMSAMATEILLRNQESHNGSREIDETGQLIFRPLSVQERIRELNLRARLFSDTIMAVQINENFQRPTAFAKNGHAISLQPSPMHTPRPSSPVNLSPYLSNKLNSESVMMDSTVSNGFGSLKRRQSRRSLQRHVMNQEIMSREDLDDCVDKEAEKLLDEREAELRKRLQGFENGSAKVLTPYEAKSLVALLHTKDCDILERVLVTLSNSAAFSVNQDHLRDAGCLVRLQHLIVHSDLSVKLAAIRATGNMAINVDNQKEMEQFVPLLLLHLNSGKFEHDHDSLLIQRTLFTLTNIAVLNDWHFQMNDHLSRFIELSWSSNPNVSSQALRLLVNLSSNDEMIPSLINSGIFGLFNELITSKPSDDALLRLLSLYYNVLTAAVRLKIFEKSKDFSTISGNVDSREILQTISRLHSNDDIRSKARAIIESLEKISSN